MFGQVIQVAGAIAILAAFALAQFRVVDGRSYSYLALNAAGALVLAVAAYVEGQWGFPLLETVWTAISLRGLAGRVRAAGR